MTDLINTTPNEMLHFNEEQLNLIKTQIARGCTNDELKLFTMVCKQTGLNPFANQIYAIKRKMKQKDGSKKEIMTIQTGIDGYRLIAHRSGKCLSISEPVFTYSEGQKLPFSATVTVKKIVGEHIGEFTGTAYWDEYYGDGKSYMANQKPRVMLGKSAEIIALKKAFPAELSALCSNNHGVEPINNLRTVEAIDDYEPVGEIDYKEMEKAYEHICKLTESIWNDLNNETRNNLMNNVLEVRKISDLRNDKNLLEKLKVFNKFVEALEV